jgi:hypothetical protein
MSVSFVLGNETIKNNVILCFGKLLGFAAIKKKTRTSEKQ